MQWRFPFLCAVKSDPNDDLGRASVKILLKYECLRTNSRQFPIIVYETIRI